MVEKLFPETIPFSKKLKLSKLLDQCSFYCMPNWGLYQNILKLSCKQISFTSHKAFLKNKRDLEIVCLPHFLHEFWIKIFLFLYSVNGQNFIVQLPLLCEILANMCVVIVCKPGCNVIHFKINLTFLIKSLFLNEQKVKRNI